MKHSKDVPPQTPKDPRLGVDPKETPKDGGTTLSHAQESAKKAQASGAQKESKFLEETGKPEPLFKEDAWHGLDRKEHPSRSSGSLKKSGNGYRVESRAPACVLVKGKPLPKVQDYARGYEDPGKPGIRELSVEEMTAAENLKHLRQETLPTPEYKIFSRPVLPNECETVEFSVAGSKCPVSCEGGCALCPQVRVGVIPVCPDMPIKDVATHKLGGLRDRQDRGSRSRSMRSDARQSTIPLEPPSFGAEMVGKRSGFCGIDGAPLSTDNIRDSIPMHANALKTRGMHCVATTLPSKFYKENVLKSFLTPYNDKESLQIVNEGRSFMLSRNGQHFATLTYPSMVQGLKFAVSVKGDCCLEIVVVEK